MVNKWLLRVPDKRCNQAQMFKYLSLHMDRIAAPQFDCALK